MSVMIEGSFIISEEKQKSRLVTPKRLRCMAVLIAAAANTKQNVFINIMGERYIEKIKDEINRTMGSFERRIP